MYDVKLAPMGTDLPWLRKAGIAPRTNTAKSYASVPGKELRSYRIGTHATGMNLEELRNSVPGINGTNVGALPKAPPRPLDGLARELSGTWFLSINLGRMG